MVAVKYRLEIDWHLLAQLVVGTSGDHFVVDQREVWWSKRPVVVPSALEVTLKCRPITGRHPVGPHPQFLVSPDYDRKALRVSQRIESHQSLLQLVYLRRGGADVEFESLIVAKGLPELISKRCRNRQTIGHVA